MAASKAKPEKRSLGFWELHRVRFWPLPLKATWGLFGEELFVWKDFFLSVCLEAQCISSGVLRCTALLN